jgi:hypothetical protein
MGNMSVHLVGRHFVITLPVLKAYNLSSAMLVGNIDCERKEEKGKIGHYLCVLPLLPLTES